MKTAIPYSDIDSYLKTIDPNKGCLVDTNFLISLTEENHHYYEDSIFIFEKLIEYNISIYYTVTVRSEFLDYQRKVKVTERLMDMLTPNTKWKISNEVQKMLKKYKGWIDNQPKENELPCLNDSKIKEIKKVFLPKTQSGKIGWIEFCNEFLSDQLVNIWEPLKEQLSLNYIDMQNTDSQELFTKKLEWKRMCSLSEKTALGSSNAMILNVLDSSALPFIVSADYDLAYGVMQLNRNKTILVPDSLYRRHLKGLKF